MKKAVIALRIAATFFLVGVVVTITKSPTGDMTSIGIISLNGGNLIIEPSSEEVYISSTLLGYIISLVATVLSIRVTGKASRFKWPLFWAILGIVSLTNEITRLFHNHVRVVLSFPLFQVIADWLAFRFLKDVEP